MKKIEDFISSALSKRQGENSLRTLKEENELIDFCSNDYLGFSRSLKLKQLFNQELLKYPEYRLGSTGSRLLAGNDRFTEYLEQQIADFHGSETSLIYNSGYDANVGLLSALLQRGDTVICDEYVHASIIDGTRLSHATRYVFRHNDLDSLEQKLKPAAGKIFIIIESVYSMDGDEAPLQAIAALAEKYHAALIVDEAHAIGILGKGGRGLMADPDIEPAVFARVVTFGKALGSHGAAVLGSSALRSYLINYSRSFIYTTAAPFLNHLLVKVAYDHLQSMDHQTAIQHRIIYFRKNIRKDVQLINSRSAIQAVVIPGNDEVKQTALKLQEAGFDTRPILSPTVPKGSERLRICLHTHNSMDEIRHLTQYLNKQL